MLAFAKMRSLLVSPFFEHVCTFAKYSRFLTHGIEAIRDIWFENLTDMVCVRLS